MERWPLILGKKDPTASTYGCIPTMDRNSERHGRYVARWRDGQTETGFDARLVLEQRGDA